MSEPDIILCAGMIRSGSTLQYQLASEIVEASGIGARHPYAPESALPPLLEQRASHVRVVKVHVCTPFLADLCQSGRARVIYCYRDIRDVAVSAQRKFEFRNFDDLWSAGWLQQAVADYTLWTAMPTLHVSVYERMAQDTEAEAASIANFLAAPMCPERARAIGRDFSFANQKARVSAIANRAPDAFDPRHLLHTNHLHEGMSGAWRECLQADQIRLLTDHFRAWLIETGYLEDKA